MVTEGRFGRAKGAREGGILTPMAVQRCRYLAANFPLFSSSADERKAGVSRCVGRGRRSLDLARVESNLTQELTGIASAVFDRSSPSPFACSIHEYEFGSGFIQN